MLGRDATSLATPSTRSVLALAAIILAGTAVRVWLMDARPLIGDEGLTRRTSGRTLSDFLFWNHHADHPPLSFVLVRLSLEAFGRSVWTLRAPSVIAGILHSDGPGSSSGELAPDSSSQLWWPSIPCSSSCRASRGCTRCSPS